MTEQKQWDSTDPENASRSVPQCLRGLPNAFDICIAIDRLWASILNALRSEEWCMTIRIRVKSAVILYFRCVTYFFVNFESALSQLLPWCLQFKGISSHVIRTHTMSHGWSARITRGIYMHKFSTISFRTSFLSAVRAKRKLRRLFGTSTRPWTVPCSLYLHLLVFRNKFCGKNMSVALLNIISDNYSVWTPLWNTSDDLIDGCMIVITQLLQLW